MPWIAIQSKIFEIFMLLPFSENLSTEVLWNTCNQNEAHVTCQLYSKLRSCSKSMIVAKKHPHVMLYFVGPSIAFPCAQPLRSWKVNSCWNLRREFFSEQRYVCCSIGKFAFFVFLTSLCSCVSLLQLQLLTTSTFLKDNLIMLLTGPQWKCLTRSS